LQRFRSMIEHERCRSRGLDERSTFSLAFSG
jgi:hypothetical protein